MCKSILLPVLTLAPLQSLGVIVALDALAIANTALFYRLDRTAGWLLVPYVAWLAYATYLNGALLQLNPDNKALTWRGQAASDKDD